MSETIDRAARLRARIAVALVVVYAIFGISFWVMGAIGWDRSFDGPLGFFGIPYLPILALPFVGKGEVAGIAVRSSVWLWWFAAQMIIAGLAIWFAPSRPIRRRAPLPDGAPDRPRVAA